MAAHYDDPNFSYVKYWQGRDYEHQCEVLAIKTLVKDTKFKHSADIGGGFGRLIPTLAAISRTATLVEPSRKLRTQAGKYLSQLSGVKIISGTAQKIPLPDNSLDLGIIIRVFHHIPEPLPALEELYRITQPKGQFIIEFANSANFKSRVISFLLGQPILPSPTEKRSAANIRRQTIPFVNHHPQTFLSQIAKSGFVVDELLSVSNFRSPLLKNWFPMSWMLWLEKITQKPLSSSFFGPSIFVLVHKP